MEIPKQILDALEEISESLENTGHVSKEHATRHLILSSDSNVHNIINSSYGLPKLKRIVERDSILILTQPKELVAYSPFEIRCSICHSIISYPAWYYRVALAVNSIHYFVCFDPSNPGKPTTHCGEKK